MESTIRLNSYCMTKLQLSINSSGVTCPFRFEFKSINFNEIQIYSHHFLNDSELIIKGTHVIVSVSSGRLEGFD